MSEQSFEASSANAHRTLRALRIGPRRLVRRGEYWTVLIGPDNRSKTRLRLESEDAKQLAIEGAIALIDDETYILARAVVAKPLDVTPPTFAAAVA